MSRWSHITNRDPSSIQLFGRWKSNTMNDSSTILPTRTYDNTLSKCSPADNLSSTRLPPPSQPQLSISCHPMEEFSSYQRNLSNFLPTKISFESPFLQLLPSLGPLGDVGGNQELKSGKRGWAATVRADHKFLIQFLVPPAYSIPQGRRSLDGKSTSRWRETGGWRKAKGLAR
jgi:hypothetical protein